MPRRRGVKRTVIGAILAFLVAPAIFIIGLVLGGGWASDRLADAPRLNPGESVQLDAGERVTLFVYAGTTGADDGTVDETSSGAPPSVACDVTGPDGQPAQLVAADGFTTVSFGGEEWREAYDVVAGPSGGYAIRCQSAQVLVLDSDFAANLAKTLVGAVVLLIAVPFVVGVAGLVSFVWGLVALSSSKKQRLAHAGYGGGYPGQQGPYAGPQGPYGGQQGPYGGQQAPYPQPGPYGSQQPYPGQQDPYGGSQQPYPGQQDPYGGSQQPYPGQQDPYGGGQDPHGEHGGGRQDPYRPSS